jgi:hypothetical protein
MAYVVNFFVQSVWNLSRDISQKGITKIFRPIVNKNGYNYEFTKDLVYKKVKKLWMVVLKLFYANIKVNVLRNC